MALADPPNSLSGGKLLLLKLPFPEARLQEDFYGMRKHSMRIAGLTCYEIEPWLLVSPWCS